MLAIWILVFIASLALLVKSADWLVESAEKVGLALKISPFIIGVTIVAIGTSFPELASSVAASLKGSTEIVAANAIGSSIANILLIVGLSAVLAFRMVIKRSLIDLDAPLLAATTSLVVFMMWDRKIVLGESILLLAAFVVYLLYTIFQRRGKEQAPEVSEVLPSRVDRRHQRPFDELLKREKRGKIVVQKLNFKIFLFLGIGIIGLIVGANYAIDALTKMSEILKIPSSLIAITALAVGTSLPELVVSVKAASKKKYEIALGNVFGSNVFNVLMVIGVPGLFTTLKVDTATFTVGLPFLVAATLLFVITGISRRIHIWEGALYLVIYALFLGKLIGLF